MPGQDRRLFRLSVCVYAALWAVLASPWLTGHVTIPYDAKAHFQAQIQFLANALHSGQSPFWAPHVFAGTPQIADPQSLIFSPAFLLAWFDAVPGFRALDAYALGMLGLGGLAVLFLFRERGWHPAGGAIAGLAFAFGASAAWRLQHLGQVQSYALFGIALFLLDRALRRGSLAWGAGAGLALGLLLVEPNQVGLIACYVLAMVVAERWLADGAVLRNLRATLPPLCGAGLVALAVAGLPLLLTYLFVAASSRPEIALGEAMRGSLHPASLLTLFVSDLFGAFDPSVEYWGPFSPAWDEAELSLSQNMSQLYVGALPALLVLSFGFAKGRLWARDARVLSLAALLAVLYALGRHTPLFAALHDHLPGVALFRRPADATFMIGALLSILAGYVLHRVLSDTPRGVLRRRAGVPLILPAVALALALAVAGAMGKLEAAAKPVALAGIWLAASLLALTMASRLARWRAGAAIVLPALLLGADLASNNGPNESTALPAEHYDVLQPGGRNATIALLKSLVHQPSGSPRRDRVELTGLGFEWPNASLVHGLDHVLGYNPLRLDTVTRALGAGDTVAGPDQRHFTPLFPSYRSTLANLLGLRYIATSVPVEEIDRRLAPGSLPLVARTRDAYIYENMDALPRAMLVRDWQLADFDRMVRTGEWPADPVATVLLEALPTGGVRATGAGLQGAAGAREDVRLLRYENTVVEVAVECPSRGFLVLNDVWHPWWVAEVDGRDAPILKANVMFRAVEVPPGRHVVRFEFRPFSKAIEQLAMGSTGTAYQLSQAPRAPTEPLP